MVVRRGMQTWNADLKKQLHKYSRSAIINRYVREISMFGRNDTDKIDKDKRNTDRKALWTGKRD